MKSENALHSTTFVALKYIYHQCKQKKNLKISERPLNIFIVDPRILKKVCLISLDYQQRYSIIKPSWVALISCSVQLKPLM